jgi:hypothetical protein
MAEGVPYVILDRKVLETDRSSEPVTSVKGVAGPAAAPAVGLRARLRLLASAPVESRPCGTAVG